MVAFDSQVWEEWAAVVELQAEGSDLESLRTAAAAFRTALDHFPTSGELRRSLATNLSEGLGMYEYLVWRGLPERVRREKSRRQLLSGRAPLDSLRVQARATVWAYHSRA